MKVFLCKGLAGNTKKAVKFWNILTVIVSYPLAYDVTEKMRLLSLKIKTNERTFDDKKFAAKINNLLNLKLFL